MTLFQQAAEFAGLARDYEAARQLAEIATKREELSVARALEEEKKKTALTKAPADYQEAARATKSIKGIETRLEAQVTALPTPFRAYLPLEHDGTHEQHKAAETQQDLNTQALQQAEEGITCFIEKETAAAEADDFKGAAKCQTSRQQLLHLKELLVCAGCKLCMQRLASGQQGQRTR